MNCIEGNVRVLRQIGEVLSLLDAETYARPLELFGGSSIGQHMRHILNFYQSLLSGAGEGIVDYASRERDPRIETDPLFAADLLIAIEASLRQLDETRALRVRADFLPDEGDKRPVVESSVGRELMYAFDHAVHHLAIVKIGLRVAMPGCAIPVELGVAPSTIQYQKSRLSGN
jgi:uncharacterized damage-inducible protein DinB